MRMELDRENFKRNKKPEIGARFRELRVEEKLSQMQLAKEFYTGQEKISLYESGYNITKKLIVLYTLRFNVNFEWLSTGEGEKYKSK